MLSAHQGQVTVSAADGCAALPRRRDPADGGRGLAIIETLAQRWGVDNVEGGKKVWVILAPYPDGKVDVTMVDLNQDGTMDTGTTGDGGHPAQ